MGENILQQQELDNLQEEYKEIRREFIIIMGDKNSYWVDIVDAKRGLVNARNSYYRQINYTKDRYKNDS